MRRTFALVGVLMVVPAPVQAATAWSPPVDGPVVRRFEPPVGPFGPGHRGVDYAVAPGTAVRAAGAGVVVFAGAVAGRLHVVLAHTGGLRTGYSFVTGLAVKPGDHVVPGTVVGRSGGTGPGHAAGVLHFSLRDSHGYADPLRLFGEVSGGAAIVRLAPLDRPSPPVCRPGLRPEGSPGPAATLRVDPAIGRESSRPQSHR
jgi:murein DD-endopeptidase MepM/ murein hydrolase activator NlpD